MATHSWNPTQYLQFEDERLRPALDLIARLPAGEPRLVVDLGCGAGNALPALAARFPGARVVGVDSSAAMLSKVAGKGFETIQADIGTWQPETPPDVIFSNAALHWLGDHERLFPRLLSLLAPGGVLAVQMPAMHAAPLRALQPVVAAKGPWAAKLAGIGSARAILEPAGYYDVLRPLVPGLELWVTEYIHVLRGERPVVEWAKGTSLLPFLDALADTPELRDAFLDAYAEALAPHYPRQSDGAVLLPFRRQFILART
ncbi:methyltransferase domain-containing protein [Acetobacteraceae bacterium H6797]|nr:methyltransferase domain-containing protein [Acetobacteraceae bacterium H6797]